MRRHRRFGEIARNRNKVAKAKFHSGKGHFKVEVNITRATAREGSDYGTYNASACVVASAQRKRRSTQKQEVVLGYGPHKRCLYGYGTTPTAAAGDALKLLGLNLRNKRSDLIKTR